MARQRLGVTHIDHALEQAKRIKTPCTGLEAAFDPKGQQRAAVRTEVLLRHRIQGVVGESRVINPFNHRMISEILCYLSGILYMAFHTQCKRLDPLKQEEAIERRQSGACISLANCPAPCYEGRSAIMFG